MKLAAIDVGSNSVHLLIARILPDHSCETIYKDKAMVRLGSRTFRQGVLGEPAQRRAMVVLTRFAQVIRKFGVDEVVGVATSAVREARNGAAFLREVRRRTGLKIDRISGQEEARLVAVAVGALPPFDRGRHLIIDIGGGSTELAFLEDQEPRQIDSYKLGCVRLAEESPLRDRPGKKALRSLEEAAAERMGALPRRLRGQTFDRVAGTSGTIVSLGMLAAGRVGRPPVRGQTFQVSRTALEKELVHLAGLTLEERRAYLGEQAQRADIIIPGGAILLAILRQVENAEIFVPDRSIRDGMLVDFIQQRLEATPDDHTRILVSLARQKAADPYDPRTVREQTVVSLARRYHYDAGHAHQVMRLAGQLFDSTQELHGLGAGEKFYLEAAALLHDIGQFIAYSQHHKHSQYLILNGGLSGFHDREIQIIANVARYHRKAFPGPTHPDYAPLAAEDRRIVDRLAALLRIADGLDYGHLSSVAKVRIEIGARRATFRVVANQECRTEISRAARKADLFEKVYGRDCRFLARRSRSRGGAGTAPGAHVA